MDPTKILIIDDSPFFRNQIENELKSIDASFSYAEDGKKGLDMALLQSYDLIISDIEMPNMDGFALCSKLKGNPNTISIPLILISSNDTDQYIDKGFRVGADSYIIKSDLKTKLLDTTLEVLKKSKFHNDNHILVVDDSSTIRSIVKDALEKAGFRVTTAVNGKDALERIQANLPDLILCDIDMPEMNGIDLCNKVRTDPDLKAIPFVIMSANDNRATMRQLLERGVSAYLVKPFNMEQMVITIEKLLSDQFLLLLKEKERLDSERQFMLSGITSLITALEARDHYTSGHSQAVSAIVEKMAAKMGMSQEEIEGIGIAGKLHDLGKIGVPDSVLLKPGKLTKVEFNLVKEHPVVGVNILGNISSLSRIIPAIRHHHERFDGKGYPDGIKGNNIPLWARLMAVADTYHALTSDRPYRDGMPLQKAMEIILSAKETQLCPDCVDLFFELIAEIPPEKLIA
ncbi:MAG: response regulator [Desulfobacteraceae bacterium]|jgi:response regulator RpfG family c-di-GMP phosphodiesterase